ncbi:MULTISPECIES: tRNA (adenine(22)-N(1))-methyltransferase [Aeribacillus]|uniref:SAM-dependent methyltransferase n=1 Tax=Aeribacillus pallidus TaxID=33936 RepID=A0A165XQJ2_9BACI|nr:tRNA (adenine(22)-N(1))-methyltransferase TrmK [Aeribacillus pallidus]KZN96296.1 SAM-dependent methyltransferase [Aeribacillus pallidus]MDR9795782.1 tRNA (adenine(22)-N(1))-methyltransferase TrmK [Aeribacillus pallidus]
MNSVQLSKRLSAVAEFVPNNQVTADIGSDHAYLPCYLVLAKKTVKAIAGEINEGPFQAAKKQVEKNGLQHVISVRKGDGLSVLQKDEATCITIAGMGGSLIKTILEEGKEKLGKVERLVLQPNIHAIEVRKWLIDNGWELEGETILEESGKIYEVLSAKRGNAMKPYEALPFEAALLMGPFLLKEKNNVFFKKWKHELSHRKDILRQLEQSNGNEQLMQKKEEIKKVIEIIEEVIK